MTSSGRRWTTSTVSAVATKPACWSPDSTGALPRPAAGRQGRTGRTGRRHPAHHRRSAVRRRRANRSGIARMDDGSEDDVATVMFLQGRVLDPTGEPLAGAVVDLGTPTPRATIPTSTRASPSTTCAGGSSPTRTAITARAASCRPAMAARPTGRPVRCSTCSVVTASGRRTFISSSPRLAIVT